MVDGGLVRPLGHPRDHLLEVFGETTGMRGPRDRLEMDPAMRTSDTAARVSQPDHASAVAQMTPAPWRSRIVDRASPVADPTSWLSPARLDFDNEAVFSKIESDDNQALDTDEFFEYCCEAHGVLPVESKLFNSDDTSGFPCAPIPLINSLISSKQGPTFSRLGNNAVAQNMPPEG